MKILILLALMLTGFSLSAQDTLFLKNGRKAQCEIKDFTKDAVKISYRAGPGAEPADRMIPLADVDYVELAPIPGEAEALALAVRDGRSDPLIQYWVRRIPWLGQPRTNGGEIGLVYAELLTRIPTKDRMQRALTIYQQIEAGDWSAERRGRAQAGRLRVMLRQGRIAEVRPIAGELLLKSGDPRVLIDLRHVMAEASAAGLAQLEKDHPRWEEEDELVPEHARLLNEAYDGYLFPHLFHGAEEDLAARGLWAAAQLSDAHKDNTQAREWAHDLTQLYAATPQAQAAADWLARQTAVTAKPPAAPDPGTAGPEPDEAPPPAKSTRKKKSASTKGKGGKDA